MLQVNASSVVRIDQTWAIECGQFEDLMLNAVALNAILDVDERPIGIGTGF